jgi:PHP family Zn ribbon phosphoesterase
MTIQAGGGGVYGQIKACWIKRKRRIINEKRSK